jgi:hypothetical protein
MKEEKEDYAINWLEYQYEKDVEALTPKKIKNEN